jgi:hypothetical protein
MRRLHLWMVAILMVAGLVPLAAQSPVSLIQYYWNDGDWNNAPTITLTPGIDVSQMVQFDTAGLAPGPNYLHYRVSNWEGKWSIPLHYFLYMPEPATSLSPVTMTEYFWDSDPGLGNAIPADLNNSVDVQQLVNLTLPVLSPGLHKFSLRVRNLAGEWSIPLQRDFYMPQPATSLSPVTMAEYFVDTDPGLGLAIPVPLTAGGDVQQMVELAMSEVPIGFHNVGIRVKNSGGKWSQSVWQRFFMAGYPENADVESITWYFTGPGVDESSAYKMSGVTPAQDVQTNQPLLLTHLVQGQTYYAHIYAISTHGKRSQEIVVKFTVDWIPDPHTAIEGENCLLSWNEISGATSYQVLAANNPTETFALIGTTGNTFWPEPILNKRFFRVKAIRE